jgi:GNAT superfamily N-acetyltransferase
MIIRFLERSDYESVLALMIQFAEETGIKDLQYDTYNLSQGRQVLLRCERAGVSVVATTEEGLIVGFLLSMKQQDLWIPEVIRLREMAWYVIPEFRGTSVGARLFFAYVNSAEKLLKRGEIRGYTMTKLSSSADFDYEKRGMRKIETLYLKEA